MEDAQLFIDVGLHKTGTTFRQNLLYPNLKNVKFYNKCFAEGVNPIFRDFNYKGKVILSDENISGPTARPEKDAVKQRTNSAKNLKKWFPDAKIIISIRNKEQWISSLYNEAVFGGYCYDFEYWLEQMDMERFDYEKYIEFLNQLFDDVLVLHFDELRKNYKEHVKKICDFIDEDYVKIKNKKLNSSLTQEQLKVLRYINIIFNRFHIPRGVLKNLLYKISTKEKTLLEKK